MIQKSSSLYQGNTCQHENDKLSISGMSLSQSHLKIKIIITNSEHANPQNFLPKNRFWHLIGKDMKIELRIVRESHSIPQCKWLHNNINGSPSPVPCTHIDLLATRNGQHWALITEKWWQNIIWSTPGEHSWRLQLFLAWLRARLQRRTKSCSTCLPSCKSNWRRCRPVPRR